MIRVVWNVSVVIHGLLQFAPTNLLAAAIRTPYAEVWVMPMVAGVRPWVAGERVRVSA